MACSLLLAVVLVLAAMVGCSSGTAGSTAGSAPGTSAASLAPPGPPPASPPSAGPASSSVSSSPAAPPPAGTTPPSAPGGTAAPARPTALPAGARAGKPTPAGQLHRHLLDFDTGSQPKQVAYRPGSQELWVTPLADGRGVEVYDAGTGRPTARIDLNDYGAVEVIFTGDGGTAYVSQMETGSVFAIDARTYRVTRRYPTQGVWTKVVALSPDERTLYASN